MKTFIISLLALIVVISLAVFGFKYWQKQSMSGETPVQLQKTLVGVLTPITSTGEYSDVITIDNQLIGVTSNTINLKPYENKKVKIVGEYSGSTMYADLITIIQ